VTARTLIWTPVPTAKLQIRLHEEGEGPAVLVPVGSGTVVLPAPAARFPRAVALARTCLRIGERALAVRWDDRAVTAHPIYDKALYGWAWGAHRDVLGLLQATNPRGPAARLLLRGMFLLHSDKRDQRSRHDAVARRFGETLDGADLAMVERVQDWPSGGPQALAALFTAAGRDDVAQVASLVDAGHADAWLAKLPADASHRAVREAPLNTVLPVVPVTQGMAPS
jgi:hypothetical protein